MSGKDLLIAIFIVVIWGVNFVVIAWGLEGMPPLLMGCLRFLLVASIGSLFFKRPDTPFRWWVAYAVPISFLQFSFLFSAMAYGMPAGLASLALQAQAMFTMVFALLFLKESIKAYQVWAFFIAAFGLIFIALSKDEHSMTALGFALTMGGAASWALGNISARSISNRGFNSNVNLVIWSAWVPPIPFFICSYFIEGPEQIASSLSSVSWLSFGALLYLALVATITGYGLWSYLLTRYPAGQIAPLSLGVPIVGLSSAALMLGESITTMQWLGIILVLLGLLINTFGGRFRRKVAALSL